MSRSSVALPRDANRVPLMGGASSSDGFTAVSVYVDPATHAMLTSGISAVFYTTPPSLSVNGTPTNLTVDSSGRLFVNPAPLTSTNDSVTAVNGGTFPGSTLAGPILGQKAVGTSQVQITSSSTPLVTGMRVRALSTNGASIFIGLTGVSTTTGYELPAGQEVLIPVNVPSLLYIISVASTTDKVSFVAA